MPRSGSLSGVPLGHVSIWQFCVVQLFSSCGATAVQSSSCKYTSEPADGTVCPAKSLYLSHFKPKAVSLVFFFLVFVSCSLELLIYSCVWGREKPKTIRKSTKNSFKSPRIAWGLLKNRQKLVETGQETHYFVHSGQDTQCFAQSRFTLKVKGILSCGRLSCDRRQDLARYSCFAFLCWICLTKQNKAQNANQTFAILFLAPVFSVTDLRQDLASQS